jgi:signal recognition particle receptor subunit beta
VNYKAEGSKIFVLGPAQSGKTLFIAGCYMRTLEIAKSPVKPSPDLLELIDQMHKEEITWPRRTQEIIKCEFTYEVGSLFPKEMILRTLDYPGPFIEKIYEYMYIKRRVQKGEKDKKYGEEIKYEMVAKEITKSDKLIFIIDGSKYPNFADMGITQYVKILGKLQENRRNVKPYIVITKSDFFTKEFPNYENDYEGLNNL